MAQTLKAALTLCLAVGLASIALGQGQQQAILGPGALFFNSDVRKDLKLSEKQIDQLKDTLSKVMANHKDNFAKFQQLSMQEQIKLTRTVSAESYKAIAGVLEAKQLKRFKQIEWQINGIGALQDPELQKELKLSDEQKKKLDGLIQEAGVKWQELAKKQETSKEKYDAVMKDAEEKVNGVLSEEQRKNLKELKGPRFEFSRPAPPPAEQKR